MLALITGATAGIGQAFAHRLASEGYELVLVARDETRLRSLSDALTAAHETTVESLPADLADPADRAELRRRISSRPIDILVNNAGFGLPGSLWTTPLADLQRQLDVNVTAVLELTRAVLPAMMERGRGGVINVSSLAALFPGQGSTYTASKNWVTSFSDGLAAAVRPSGVRVLTLCPGFTDTEFHDRAGLARSGPRFLWLSPERVVAEALVDLRRGRVLSVPGKRYRVIAAIGRHLPRGLVWRMRGRFTRRARY